MSYTKLTNFGAKDSLPSGDTNKIVKGAEFDTEFNNIAAAITTLNSTVSGLGNALTTGCPAGVVTNSTSVQNSNKALASTIPANSGWLRLLLKGTGNITSPRTQDFEMAVGSGTSNTVTFTASGDNNDSYLGKVFYVYWPPTS
jgi:hypothetical protein